MNAVVEIAPSVTKREHSSDAGAGALEPPIILNPLEHPKWDALLTDHGNASFFHSSSWARVLCETYGHRPVYFCRFVGGQLKQLLPLMEVSSRLTGRRGVSLPFSDFCPPLGGEADNLCVLYESAASHGRKRNWAYLECRGNGKRMSSNAATSLGFFGHTIHLVGGEAELFGRMDSAVRRGVRKAQRYGLQVEFTNAVEAMEIYYALHCGTRRCLGLPPQPFRFFKNLQRHAVAANHGFVGVVRQEQEPVAAAVFLHEGRHVLYKFGASDLKFQRLRPNNLLMWEAVRHCAVNGFADLHLGRTSLCNEGLRRFKLGFGATEERIEYTKHDLRRDVFLTDTDRAVGPLNAIFRRFPMPLLRLAGRGLYPHLS